MLRFGVLLRRANHKVVVPFCRNYNTNLESVNNKAADTSTLTGHKVHLNFKHFRENVESIKQNIKERGADADIEKVVDLHHRYLSKDNEVSLLRKRRNEISDRLKGKVSNEERASLVEEAKNVKNKLKDDENEVSNLYNEMFEEGVKIPNDSHPDSPVDNFNVVKLVGAPPMFDFPTKDHMEIGEMMDLFDFETGSQIAGGKFYYTKNDAVLLELALVNWAVQEVRSRGFTPILTPDVVHSKYSEACGFRPRSPAAQIYSIENHDLCLIGTSEISTAALYFDKLFNPTEATSFPHKYVAFSHCFRAETGHRGRLSRGLYRVHQFSKVEMFMFCLPEDSERLHEEILQIEIDLLTKLGLHFRVLDMPKNELGGPAYRKYDIEAWFPSRNDFGEVTSCSNCTDYQSRRLNIRIKGENGEQSKFLHTLNGTALAVPRIIMAILENFQNSDHSVTVPSVLVPFMGGIQKLEKKIQL
eukprot:TRINITY_DN7583_c0_g1_i1.p1 TRINITY_DN7583_c0_g1~~TRINITY_DN7583_c0_g1_i1.p1  ORF type:complete len:472 (+),score=89.16 TRINITY_DN7583_c0_g1_i1:166-1581(+)